MTPHGFPDTETYRAYVLECEESLGKDYQWNMQPALCGDCNNTQPCLELDHQYTDKDGFAHVWYIGGDDAAHAVWPIFNLKPYLDGCNKYCNTCLDDDSLYWQNISWHRTKEVVYIFNELDPETNLKRETKADYTLSEKVSHP